MEEKWINNLRKKMNTYEATEPEGLWDDIENSLNNAQEPSKNNKVLWWLSGIAGIAAMFTLILLLNKGDFTKKNIPVSSGDTEVVQQNIKNSVSNESDKKSLTYANSLPSYSKNKTSQVRSQRKRTKDKLVSSEDKQFIRINKKNNAPQVAESKADDADKKVINPDKAKKEVLKRRGKDEKTERQKKLTTFPDNNSDSFNSAIIKEKAKNKNKLLVSVYNSNRGNSKIQRKNYDNLFRANRETVLFSANKVTEPNDLNSIVFSNMGIETHTETEHKQPIRTGIAIRYQLMKRFSIESGFNYTYLSSDLKSGSPKNFYETEQSLQYIGIPINISYEFLEKNKFGMYVSAGAMIEKNVSGKSHTNYVMDNKLISSENKTISEKEPQFSVNSSLGLQYNISSKVGLFIEPGISYYFNNGSSVQNIYKDKPFNFNFMIGLRFDL